MSLEFCSWHHNINTTAATFSINHSCMKEIEAFYSQRKGAKVIRVQDLDEFHLVDDGDDDDDVAVGVVLAIPAPGDVPI